MPIPRRIAAPAREGHSVGVFLSCVRSHGTIPGWAGGPKSPVPHPRGSAGPGPARGRLPRLPWVLPCSLPRCRPRQELRGELGRDPRVTARNIPAFPAGRAALPSLRPT